MSDETRNLPEIPDVKLHTEIARGGMGVVYRGRQDFLDRDVAVKLLSSDLQGDLFAARFRREAKILAGIKHPNIVGCHTAGTTSSGQSYLVMEFIDGPNLKAWIAENGAVPLPAALRLTRQLASALSHAAELDVIHRDVKPENILLESPTSTSIDLTFPYVPKLVDLGLARMKHEVGDLGMTAPGAVMGTPIAMAPEQFDAPDAVDFRADIYGLGYVLYEMLTGVSAFEGTKLTDVVIEKRRPRGPDPCERSDEVPAAVGEFVATMLACDPAERPGGYRELIDRIEKLSADVARGAGPVRGGNPGRGRGAGAVSSSSGTGSSSAPLLQTAEFEFLAESGEIGGRSDDPNGGASAVFLEPTGAHDRPAAGPPATVTGTPTAKTKPNAGPTTRPVRRRGLRRVLVVVVTMVLVLAGVTVLKKNRRNQANRSDQPASSASNSPGGRPPRSQTLTIRGLDGAVRPDVKIDLRADARYSDRDNPRFHWSARPRRATNLSKSIARATTLQLEGLPGDSFTIKLEARGIGAKPIRTEKTFQLDYQPIDLLADFLRKDTSWTTTSRIRRGKWSRRARDGAVTLHAPSFPCFRSRRLEGSVWRVTGQLRPERLNGPGFAHTAACLRIGAERLLAVLCERTGDAGEQWSISLQLAKKGNRGRFDFRPLTREPKTVMILDGGGELVGARYSITRRSNELVFTFGFSEAGETVEHRESVRPSMSAMLVLFANGGRGVFPVLELW